MIKMKLVLKAAMLALMVIGLTPSTTKNMSFAAPTSCSLDSCFNKCVQQGYLGGTCGSITHTCVCYSYPPPRD
jgi:hypothetical protein